MLLLHDWYDDSVEQDDGCQCGASLHDEMVTSLKVAVLNVSLALHCIACTMESSWTHTSRHLDGPVGHRPALEHLVFPGRFRQCNPTRLHPCTSSIGCRLLWYWCTGCCGTGVRCQGSLHPHWFNMCAGNALSVYG